MIPIHGGQPRHIAQHFHVNADQLIDFSASINPDGPPASVLAAIRAALERPSTLTTYPDLDHTALKQAIAAHTSAPIDTISIANGFVPLLQAALLATRLSHTLLPVPAFNEYRRTLTQARTAITPYALKLQHLRYDPDALLEAALASSCDSILLANPQNPTGILTPAASLLRLIQQAAAHNITLLLDEAFIDYAPTESLLHKAHTHPNLILFRSVTKFFAIPGLRVAYAISSPTHTRAIHATLPPWPVSNLDSTAVIAALADEPYQHHTRTQNESRREDLRQQLETLGLHVYPSQANFLLLKLPPHLDAAIIWQRLIQQEHHLVRACANFEQLPPNHLRIAIRTQPENDALLRALIRTMA